MNKRTKIHIRTLVEKLNNNNYDTNDLEVLLTELRSYVPPNSFTRELGDFINHAEGKTKGKLHDAIAYMFYQMLFFKEYRNTEASELTLDTMFPSYFKSLLEVSLKRKSIMDNITKRIGIKHDQALNIINRILPKALNGKLDKNHCSEKNMSLINDCLSLLCPGSEIDADTLLDDLIRTIKLLNSDIGLELDLLTLDQNKLVLHVLDILNAKEFLVDKNIVGYCSLHLERKELKQSMLDSLKPEETELYNKWSTFGNIELAGTVIINGGASNEFYVSFTIITTEIDSMSYLDETLLIRTKDEMNKDVTTLNIPEVFTISSENKIIEFI
jgi:hypothetical protein